MRCPRSTSLALAAALALSGCSYGDNMLDWATGSSAPTNRTNGSGLAPAVSVPIAPSAAEANPQPTLTTTALPGSGPAVSTAPTGTFVGMKVQSLRAELAQLQGNIGGHQQQLAAARQSLASSATSYFGVIAGINARLQAGTTPGNPQLVAQWGQAQSILDRMDAGVAQLNSLSNGVASDSSFGNYLLRRRGRSRRAPSDREPDHRRALANRSDAQRAER
jgi:hypothetical protein